MYIGEGGTLCTRGGGYPMYIGRGVPNIHRGGGALCTCQLHTHTPPPHQIQMVPFRKPGGPQNGPKRSFFGPKFCLLSEFERIFEKSQIFFKFRGNFRKEVGQKQVKNAFLTHFGPN